MAAVAKAFTKLCMLCWLGRHRANAEISAEIQTMLVGKNRTARLIKIAAFII